MIYSPDASIFDSDAYGVDTDSAEDWRDNFFPKNEECNRARDKYEEAMYEILDDIADDFGINTSEWNTWDYSDFKEIVGL